MNQYDIERIISSLQTQKSEWVNKKKEWENQLSAIKNKIRSNGQRLLPEDEYKKLCKKQDTIKGEILYCENEMSKLSAELRKKHIVVDEFKVNLKAKGGDLMSDRLIEIKDYYINFAADKSRVSSMRVMAAEFAEKIEEIIRQAN